MHRQISPIFLNCPFCAILPNLTIDNISSCNAGKLCNMYVIKSIRVKLRVRRLFIGHDCATVNKIGRKHNVLIEFPNKQGVNPREIVISGYKNQTHAAAQEILRIVDEEEEEDNHRRAGDRLQGACPVYCTKRKGHCL